MFSLCATPPSCAGAADVFACRLADRDFHYFGQLIHGLCGIRLGEQKRSMLEGRLRKRLRHLGLPSFEAYRAYVASDAGRPEQVHLIDAVTTNKTDFFREPFHFDFLAGTLLPALAAERHGNAPLRFWSAGCATGEEPYTLAMVTAEFAETRPGLEFAVLGTDISTRALEAARLGIYEQARVAPVPAPLRRRYLLRSRDRERGLVRIAPELRARVDFRRLNFLEADFGLDAPVDVLFCRNVLIYFDKATQAAILHRLCRYLRPGKFLFTGHAESLNGLHLPLQPVAPSVYRRTG